MIAQFFFFVIGVLLSLVSAVIFGISILPPRRKLGAVWGMAGIGIGLLCIAVTVFALGNLNYDPLSKSLLMVGFLLFLTAAVLKEVMN